MTLDSLLSCVVFGTRFEYRWVRLTHSYSCLFSWISVELHWVIVTCWWVLMHNFGFLNLFRYSLHSETLRFQLWYTLPYSLLLSVHHWTIFFFIFFVLLLRQGSLSLLTFVQISCKGLRIWESSINWRFNLIV